MEQWVTVQDALAYYGVSINTLHKYRRKGLIKSRPCPYRNSFGYEYLLDEEFKNKIEIVKTIDNRYK